MQTGDRVGRERGLRSAVLAGDERAWRTWYDEHFDGLYGYVAWRTAGMRDLTDEVVQETWLIAVRSIRRFDPARASFGVWLRGIAANVLRNHVRKRARLRRRFEPLSAECPARDGASSAVDAERVALALAGLPERYEAVLRAKYLDEDSVTKIAADGNETAKAVESLLTRARQAFREAYLNLE